MSPSTARSRSMSRAAFSVVMNGRMPPLFASQASAKSAFALRRAPRSIRRTRGGRPGCRRGRSPCPRRRRQVTAVDSPTPRGSKPITSNCCCSGCADGEVDAVADQTDAARTGTAGVRQQRPDRRSPTSARWRITESSISPADGSAQSSGAVTVVHSKPVAVRPVERLLVERQQRRPRRRRCRARGSPSTTASTRG